MGKNQQDVLESYISQHNLKVTRQRRAVLKAFLECDDHVSAEELYRAVSQIEPKIGLATVYRTLALLTESGLAAELDFGDGQKRYEQNFASKHHDHMICIETGKIIEFVDSRIEDIQDEIAEKYGYKIIKHVHQLFVKPIKK